MFRKGNGWQATCTFMMRCFAGLCHPRRCWHVMSCIYVPWLALGTFDIRTLPKHEMMSPAAVHAGTEANAATICALSSASKRTHCLRQSSQAGNTLCSSSAALCLTREQDIAGGCENLELVTAWKHPRKIGLLSPCSLSHSAGSGSLSCRVKLT